MLTQCEVCSKTLFFARVQNNLVSFFCRLVLGNFDHEGRFTGMQMAASIYGGCVCLFLIILLESDLSKFFKYFYFLVGFPFLLFSSTSPNVPHTHKVSYKRVSFYYCFSCTSHNAPLPIKQVRNVFIFLVLLYFTVRSDSTKVRSKWFSPGKSDTFSGA